MSDDRERERLVAKVEATRHRLAEAIRRKHALADVDRERERLAIETKAIVDFDAAIAELEKGNRLAASWWKAYQRSDCGLGGLEQMEDAERIVGRALAKLEEIRSRQPRGGEGVNRG